MPRRLALGGAQDRALAFGLDDSGEHPDAQGEWAETLIGGACQQPRFAPG